MRRRIWVEDLQKLYHNDFRSLIYAVFDNRIAYEVCRFQGSEPCAVVAPLEVVEAYQVQLKVDAIRGDEIFEKPFAVDSSPTVLKRNNHAKIKS
jgi:hypothetical protein